MYSKTTNEVLPTSVNYFPHIYQCTWIIIAETILLKSINDMLMNMDSQCVIPVVSCDLSVAFDTVNHSILLNVLESYFSVKDTAVSWFKDYLSKRSMQVQVNNNISSKKMLNVRSLKVVVVALYYLMCM